MVDNTTTKVLVREWFTRGELLPISFTLALVESGLMNSSPAILHNRVHRVVVLWIAVCATTIAMPRAATASTDAPLRAAAEPTGPAVTSATQDEGQAAASADSRPIRSAASEAKSQDEQEAVEQAARKAEQERASRATARAKGEITFDDLKFDIEKDGDFQRSMITKEIEELDKRTIRIRGYILPQSVFKSKGFEEFVLVRDNQECCFGPGAALYDCIMVRMEKGKKADFVTRPVAVKGKFEIKEFKYPDSDKHYAIYQLTATEVK